MTKPQKLTVVFEEPEVDELREWALEEGRPVSNLLRRIALRSLKARRQQQQTERAA